METLKNFLFKNQTTRQTVAKNTLWLLIGQVFGRLLRAVIVISAARVLGAANWGIWSYAISFSAFLTIFTDLGINAVLTKETTRLKKDRAGTEVIRRQIISTALLVKGTMIAVGLIIINTVAPLVTRLPEALPLLPVVGLILAFDNLREFGFSITRALEKMEVEAFFYTLTNIFIVSGGLAILALRPTPLALASAYAAGTGLGMAITFFYLRDYLHPLWRYCSWERAKSILTSAWPFALLSMMGGLMINTDLIILGWFRGAEEIGFYSAAQKPVQALYILPTLIAASVFPTLARVARVNDAAAAAIIGKTLRMLILAALPIALVGVFLGPDIIDAVFGASYLPATLSWQILIGTVVIVFPGMILGNAIFAYDQQRRFILALAIGAISNIGLDFLLIPRWGAPGSAAATVVAQFLANGFLWFQLRKINPRITQPRLVSVALAAILLAISLTALQWAGVNFIINILVTGLLYLGLLFIVKEPILAWLGLLKS